MDGLMSSVGIQIQRTIKETVTEQVLPQFHASLRAGSGQIPRMCLNIRSERPERRSVEAFSQKIRSSSRSEFPRNQFCEEDEEDIRYSQKNGRKTVGKR